jgi:hypothetical protein
VLTGCAEDPTLNTLAVPAGYVEVQTVHTSDWNETMVRARMKECPSVPVYIEPEKDKDPDKFEVKVWVNDDFKSLGENWTSFSMLSWQ